MSVCESVDLPDPFGPISVCTSPERTSRSTPRRICTAGARCTCRSARSSSGRLTAGNQLHVVAVDDDVVGRAPVGSRAVSAVRRSSTRTSSRASGTRSRTRLPTRHPRTTSSRRASTRRRSRRSRRRSAPARCGTRRRRTGAAVDPARGQSLRSRSASRGRRARFTHPHGSGDVRACRSPCRGGGA